MRTCKMLLLSDSNLNPMIRFLAEPLHGVSVKAEEGPFNQVHQVLMNPHHACWNGSHDELLIWTRPETMIPSFNDVLNNNEVNIEQILQEVDQFCDLLISVSTKIKHMLVVSWSLPPHYRWIQTLTLKHNMGLDNILMRMNLHLAERLDEYKQIVILHSQYWFAGIQQKSYDSKMFMLGKIPYTREFFAFVSREIKSVLSGLYGHARKLIICDLDNTLWGGTIGDDGMDNIKLGGIDPIGESFKAFQLQLKRLSNRGVLLAVSSKNTESVALEMMENHPEMVLRKKDFAALRINWRDKAESVLEIVQELNLGMQSVVFLDDNPTERERIRQVFPEVYVPDLPEDFTQYPVFIHQLDCFETSAITVEDRSRVDWFNQEKEREAKRKVAGSLEEWLNSLELKVTVHKLNENLLPRVVQLLNKTNQFNMATRRFTQEDFWSWSQQSDHHVFVYKVEDKFGDAGYTGVTSVSIDTDSQIEIHDFVMSCRVMGKGIEEAMLYCMATINSFGKIKARYMETSKNKPFYDFISGKYESQIDGWLNTGSIKLPNHIKLIGEETISESNG